MAAQAAIHDKAETSRFRCPLTAEARLNPGLRRDDVRNGIRVPDLKP